MNDKSLLLYENPKFFHHLLFDQSLHKQPYIDYGRTVFIMTGLGEKKGGPNIKKISQGEAL